MPYSAGILETARRMRFPWRWRRQSHVAAEGAAPNIGSRITLTAGGDAFPRQAPIREPALLPSSSVVQFLFRLVGQAVLFVEPTCQVDPTTTVAAERWCGGLIGIDRFVADWTAERGHDKALVLLTETS